MEINIQEILKKHCAPCIYNDSLMSKEVKKAIKEIITEVLKEAADSAKLCDNNYHDADKPELERVYESAYVDDYTTVTVSKESITSTINKVKF